MRVAVLGAGLAGAHVVSAWAERGVSDIVWLDAANRARASDVPCAMVHPFVGRSFQPTPGLGLAWQAARTWLEALPGIAACHRARVRRWMDPVLGGERLERSYARHREELIAMVERSSAGHSDGTPWVEYEPAYGLSLAGAVSAMTLQLRAQGMPVIDAEVETIDADGDRWRVCRKDGGEHDVDVVVVAAGEGSERLVRPWASDLRLRRVAGVLRVSPGAPLERFDIDGGHLASSRAMHAWGSSYGTSEVPDLVAAGQQLDAIEQRLRRRRDGWSPPQAVTWTGVRVVNERTRAPWAEILRPGLAVLTALGSKGSLWTPYLAQRLVDALDRGRSALQLG